MPDFVPDHWISDLKRCKFLQEDDMKILCDRVRSLLMEESNIQPVSSPVTICGDIHGQFWDLLELLRKGGDVPETSYIFMGDFVDRGHYSLETVSLLLVLKARWPDKVTLLRGNHESRQITQVYGFYDECQQKYGNATVWKACCSVFDFLNLAAIIDGEVLCVHGGLSPDIRTLDQIRVLSRAQEIPHEGAFCDLMWSDPDDVENWAVSPRGAGWLFGGNVTKEFNHVNSLGLIARAHQLVQEGYKYMFDQQLVTVWSAPNYCYRCGNMASIMTVHDSGEKTFEVYGPAPENERDKGMHVRKMNTMQYFLLLPTSPSRQCKLSLVQGQAHTFELVSLPIPEVGDDEILVKVTACGICGSDKHLLDGAIPQIKLPIVPGHEVVGKVAQIGKDVIGFSDGERVVIDPTIACGRCFYCNQSIPNHCEKLGSLGWTKTGGFADHVVASSKNVFKISNALSDEDATLIEPLSVAIHVLEQLELKSDASVLVLGAGPSGTFRYLTQP
ncbi:sporulation-induced protein, variant 2 [Stygiomarasmius scandens]|uniref:Serine/threonine-protein phosphatase n=1 Tax=Marasmiellus scandens TaxID=2682957 RepID=A0ABR1IRR2_9AGAR